MRLIGKIKLVCQSSSHLLFQINKILGMDFLLKAFLSSRVAFPFPLAMTSPGQLGRGLKFNEKYPSCKQGSMTRETSRNKAVRRNNLAALENLYSKSKALELPVKTPKFATALSVLNRLPVSIQRGQNIVL